MGALPPEEEGTASGDEEGLMLDALGLEGGGGPGGRDMGAAIAAGPDSGGGGREVPGGGMDAPLLQIVFGAGDDAGSLWLSRNWTYRSGPQVHPTAFIQEIPPDLICRFCSDVLLDPITVEDGSNLCRHCAAATRGEMFAYSVPGNPEPAEKIQSLRVLCTFGFAVKPTGAGRFSITTDRKGCGHICLLRDRAAHEQECDFEPVACGLPGKLP